MGGLFIPGKYDSKCIWKSPDGMVILILTQHGKIWNKSKYHGKIFVSKLIKIGNQGNLEKKSRNLNLMSSNSFSYAV